MILYRITLTPLVEELWKGDPGILNNFYVDDAAFNGLTRRSAQLLKLILERVPDQEYLPNPAELLFMEDFPDQEEVAKQELEAEGLQVKFVGVNRYLGAYMGPREELEV